MRLSETNRKETRSYSNFTEQSRSDDKCNSFFTCPAITLLQSALQNASTTDEFVSLLKGKLTSVHANMVWTEAPQPPEPPSSLPLYESSCCSSSSSSSPTLDSPNTSVTPTILLTPSTPTSPPIHIAVRRAVSKVKETEISNQNDCLPGEEFSYPDTSSMYSEFHELSERNHNFFSDEARMSTYLRNKNLCDREVESIVLPGSPSTISSLSSSSSSSPLSPRFFNPYLPLSPTSSPLPSSHWDSDEDELPNPSLCSCASSLSSLPTSPVEFQDDLWDPPNSLGNVMNDNMTKCDSKKFDSGKTLDADGDDNLPTKRQISACQLQALRAIEQSTNFIDYSAQQREIIDNKMFHEPSSVDFVNNLNANEALKTSDLSNLSLVNKNNLKNICEDLSLTENQTSAVVTNNNGNDTEWSDPISLNKSVTFESLSSVCGNLEEQEEIFDDLASLSSVDISDSAAENLETNAELIISALKDDELTDDELDQYEDDLGPLDNIEAKIIHSKDINTDRDVGQASVEERNLQTPNEEVVGRADPKIEHKLTTPLSPVIRRTKGACYDPAMENPAKGLLASCTIPEGLWEGACFNPVILHELAQCCSDEEEEFPEEYYERKGKKVGKNRCRSKKKICEEAAIMKRKNVTSHEISAHRKTGSSKLSNQLQTSERLNVGQASLESSQVTLSLICSETGPKLFSEICALWPDLIAR